MRPLRFWLAASFAFVSAFSAALLVRADDPSTAIATIDGQVILLEEIEKPIGATLAALKQRIYELQRQKLETLIGERLVAKEAERRGVSVDGLLDAEVTAKVQRVTDSEVESFYQENQARLPTQEPDLRERIRTHLQNQKLNAQRDTFVSQLRSMAKVEIFLPELPVYRASVNIDGAPFRGAADAPVVIVKFEDFHCPFCKESQPTLAQLLSRYPDRVKVVHKDFPIDELHPGARPAHLAARCAHEQGQFWPYHDALYRNVPKAAPEDLKKYATEVALDLAAFERCLASGNHAVAIQANIEEGRQAGVSGTPAFFINGRLVSGAQPIERFTQLIDEELARRP